MIPRTIACQEVTGFLSMQKALLLCTWGTHAASDLVTWKVLEYRGEDQADLAASSLLFDSRHGPSMAHETSEADQRLHESLL